MEDKAIPPPRGRLIPSSPFEINASKEILQRRIEAGDITQDDVELLKKGYGWMTTSAFVGSAAMGLGTLYALRRRRPPVALGFRLLGAGAAGMLGSFLGFTVGGVAAAMEVEKNMTDSQRKLRVFAEIANESRKTIYEHRIHDMQESGRLPNQRQRPISGDASNSVGSRNGLGGPSSSSSQYGVDSTPTWDVEGDEKRMEEDRRRDLGNDINRIQSDSKFANDNDNASLRENKNAGQKEISRATRGTWDKIRQDTFSKITSNGGDTSSGSSEGSKGVGGGVGRNNDFGMKEDERSREQREFDAMLERERQGVKSDDKWA